MLDLRLQQCDNISILKQLTKFKIYDFFVPQLSTNILIAFMVPQHDFQRNNRLQQGIIVGVLQPRRLRKRLNGPLPSIRSPNLSQSDMDNQPTKHRKFYKKEQPFQPLTLSLPTIRLPQGKQRLWNQRQTPKRDRQIQLLFDDGRVVNHQFSDLISKPDLRCIGSKRNRLYSEQSSNKIHRSERESTRTNSQTYTIPFHLQEHDRSHKNNMISPEIQLKDIQIKDPFDCSKRQESSAFIRSINQCSKYQRKSQQSRIALFSRNQSSRT